MRLMDWNIEWMNNWFVGNGQIGWRISHRGIESVQNLAQRVANVILSIDPDVLTIQEGPSDPREMDLFVDGFLTDSGQKLYNTFGGVDGRAQKVYILVKQNGKLNNAQQVNDDLTSSMLEEWMADIDGDTFLESYHFTRDPFAIDGTISDTDESIRIISLHTKSKFVNQQRQMWEDPNRRHDFIVAALKNRRRISTEAMHTREYLDNLYENDSESLVAITGDFNDGPGIDYFEKNYLTHGVADIIIGSSYHPERQFKHVLIGNVPNSDLYTARFNDFIDEIDDRPVLLDHILLSPALEGRYSNPRIAHNVYDSAIDASRPVNDRDRYPSDHRPIVVDIT